MGWNENSVLEKIPFSSRFDSQAFCSVPNYAKPSQAGEAKGRYLRTLKKSFSSVAASVSPTAPYTSGT